jgi:hypothetical protein
MSTTSSGVDVNRRGSRRGAVLTLADRDVRLGADVAAIYEARVSA